MTTQILLGDDFAGKTSAPPTEPPYERSVTCRRCGSSLQGRRGRRYERQRTRWPFERELVEIFACPCGARRQLTREAS